MRAVTLAQHFEVSTRTIERDLHALQEAGVPIWAQPGPGGGYGLNVETTLPPLNLTPAEAAALAMALAALGAMPLAEAGRSALKKLTAVMAAGSRDTAAQLLTQIRVVQGPHGPATAGHFATIDWLSRRLGEAGIQEKRVAIDEMWFNRLGEVIR